MLLKEYIHTYLGIDHYQIGQIEPLFEKQILKKGEFWIKKDSFNSPLSFVKQGYLRVYAIDQGGTKEITQWLSTPDSFLADLSSLVFDTAIRFNIQALSDCELYTISNRNYKKINQLVPQWSTLEKLFISKCFTTLEGRVFQLLSLSAEERYDKLMEQNAALFNHIPHLYIASMLNMTPETLSRIRKKKLS